MSTTGEPPAVEEASGDSGGRDWFGGARKDGAAEADAAQSAEPGAASTADSNAGPAAEPLASPAAEPTAQSAGEPTAQPPTRAHLRLLTGGRATTGVPEPEAPLTADDRSATEGADAPAPPADFRVRCPDCGPQYVAVADVRFVSTGGGPDTDRYLFTCPACGIRVRRPAGPELAQILRTSGVATLALRRGPDQAL